MANVVVFCGSSSGISASHTAMAVELGSEIGRTGNGLVYGGGDVGLMGVVADAVMRAGGPVTGVITERLAALEVAHDGLTALHVEESMHARKARMAELGDGVVVLPGGFGTYEEVFEILTWNQLGLVSMPVTFLNVDDFYGPLLSFIAGAVDAGFLKPEHGALASASTTAADAVAIATQPAPAYTPKWVG